MKRAAVVHERRARAVPETLLEFGVGVALRAVIARDGEAVPRLLYAALDRCNRQHFAGRLPDVTILLTNPGSPRALGDHTPLDAHGIAYRVRIAPAAVRRGEKFVEDVLLHELVHVAAAMAHEPEPGYAGHGPLFASRCNAIGAELGLPRVGARPRGKAALPGCAQWPVCVRPPGYYGEEDAPPKPALPPAPAPADEPEHDGPVRQWRTIVKDAVKKLEAGDAVFARDLLRAALRQCQLAPAELAAGALMTAAGAQCARCRRVAAAAAILRLTPR